MNPSFTTTITLLPFPLNMPSRIADTFTANFPSQKQTFDFTSLKELPDTYAWMERENDITSPTVTKESESVPVIELDDPNAMNLIAHACKTWGVFHVKKHGIPLNLLADVECEGQRLFSLPVQQKLKAARSPDGISGYGVARISSFFPKKMWSEGFTIVGSPVEHARSLWPDQQHTQFCDVIETYKKEMKQLCGRLMWLMLGSLGISNKEEVKWSGPIGDFSEACDALQMNSYPACPDPDRAMGLAAHTDSTLFTVLYQNNTSGLQVLKEGMGWVTVSPIPGALVINVGDLFQILSNGLYKSVLHRAVVNKTRHRLSLAYLYGPPRSVCISPLPILTGPACPPLYRSITWSEYLNTKAKHFNKALSSVQLCATMNGVQDVNENKNAVELVG